MKLGGKRLLGYGDARGHPRLRAALAEMLSSLRGLAVHADELIITRGSQGALDLVARTLLRPGDTVAVEAIGYRPAGTRSSSPVPASRPSRWMARDCTWRHSRRSAGARRCARCTSRPTTTTPPP
ncbi:aminotransferase class I/II-fold pyridoxal phosphate-dependent enzyme [Cystobacter fuscus]